MMALRTKISLIIGVGLTALALIVYASAQTILVSSFVETETESVQSNIGRAADALSEDLTTLNRDVSTWSDWDDTYAFIVDRNQHYIDSNLTDSTFEQLNLNLMVMANESGEVVFGESFDLQTNTTGPVPASFLSQLSTNSAVLQHGQPGTAVSGIVILPEGPLLIASRPILTSNSEGPSHGTVIMGQYLNAAMVGELASLTHLALSVQSIDSASLPADIRSSLVNASADKPMVVHPINDQGIVGYTLMKDIYNKPALVLRIDGARTIYQHGQTTIGYLMLWLLGIMLASGAIAQVLAGRLIRSQQLQQASEERYRSFVEQSVEGISLLDEHGAIIEWSHGSELITGLMRAEVLGQFQWDVQVRLIPPERVSEAAREQLKAQVLQALATGQAPFLNRTLAAEYQRADGSRRFMEQVVFAIKTERGFRLGVIARDVTDRKQAEEELRKYRDHLEELVEARTDELQQINQELQREFIEHKRVEDALRISEAQFRDLFENSPDAIFVEDFDGVVLDLNLAACRLNGASREELVGKNVLDLVPPNTKEEVVRNFQKVASGELSQFESLSANRNGRAIPVDIRVSHIDYAGRQVLLFHVRDVTDRKLAEASLRASEEQFRQLAENIHEVFWVTSPKRDQIFYISPAYEEIWGRTSDSLYQDPRSLFDTIYPEDRKSVLNAFVRQRQGQPTFAEFRILRPDGSIGWVWARDFPIRDERGEVYRIVGIAEDVTERKQAEEKLRHALAQEKDLVELKSRFISMASHEFRTPLTAIMSSADLLDHYGHKFTDERKQHYLRQIHGSVRSMTGLLDDVLTIGKAEAGKLEFNPALLDLEQFCHDLVEELQLGAGGKNQIVFTSPQLCAAVTMDPKLLRHILNNLLSNAIKYSPDGGLIEFEVTCQQTEALFRIADHGIGIPPKALAHLFETFHRADNVGSIPGTGLGLAIVKKSVDLHHGVIEFSSEVGMGTVCLVRLPTTLRASIPEESKS